MTNALDRSELRGRRGLIDQMETVRANALITYAANESLPATIGKWTTAQLQSAVAHFFSSKTEQTPIMSPAKKPKSYLITYPVGKPGKATGVIAKALPAEDAAQVAFLVTSPADLVESPMPALLALVNATRTTPIKKFTDAQAAAEAAFQALSARAEPASTPKSEPSVRAIKAVDYAPKAKDELKVVRAGTKVATAIDLLSREGGILLSELEAELSKTGKPVSARAWLGYDVKSVVGYGVRSEPTDEGLRVFLVLPKGMKAPLAHKTVTEKPVKATPAAKAAKATKVAPEPEVEVGVPGKQHANGQPGKVRPTLEQVKADTAAIKKAKAAKGKK